MPIRDFSLVSLFLPLSLQLIFYPLVKVILRRKKEKKKTQVVSFLFKTLQGGLLLREKAEVVTMIIRALMQTPILTWVHL